MPRFRTEASSEKIPQRVIKKKQTEVLTPMAKAKCDFPETQRDRQIATEFKLDRRRQPRINISEVTIAESREVFNLWLHDPESRERNFTNVKDAAITVGKAPNTIRSWFHSGRLLGVKIGGEIHIYRKGIEERLRRDNEP